MQNVRFEMLPLGLAYRRKKTGDIVTRVVLSLRFGFGPDHHAFTRHLPFGIGSAPDRFRKNKNDFQTSKRSDVRWGREINPVRTNIDRLDVPAIPAAELYLHGKFGWGSD